MPKNNVVKTKWHVIRIPDYMYNKLKKISTDKNITIHDAIFSLEKIVIKNFPHSTKQDLIACVECRASVIGELKEKGYWPEPKEVIKIVEVPAKGPIKHLTAEIIPAGHLLHGYKGKHLT